MPGTHLARRRANSSLRPVAVAEALRSGAAGGRRFIVFNGADFGPYKTEREAKLFAIDAAFKLGEKGEESEVLVADEAGTVAPYGSTGSILIRRACSAASLCRPSRSAPISLPAFAGTTVASSRAVLQGRPVCANRPGEPSPEPHAHRPV